MPDIETYTHTSTCVSMCASVSMFCTHRVQDGILETVVECSNNKLTM